MNLSWKHDTELNNYTNWQTKTEPRKESISFMVNWDEFHWFVSIQCPNTIPKTGKSSM